LPNVIGTELEPLFNEIHTDKVLQSNQFTLAKTYVYKDTEMHAYVRRLVDEPQIVAMQFKQVNDITGFVPWQPWHTMFLHKQTGEAIQVIWDTREIIGYAKLPEETIKHLLSGTNANDNCMLFYKRCEMPDNTAFSDYIIDTIIQ
jgi:hypothetical protein